MGREIKFRAWTGTKYETDVVVGIFGVFYVNPYNNGLDEDDKASLTRFNTKLENIIIEQFTGLHDKNGKEIWENDVISFSEFDHRGVVQFARGVFGVNWDYKKNPDPEWKEGKLYGGWGRRHNLRDFEDDILEEITVIGNIHENPDMLERTN